METTILKVEGMSCEHCVKAVTDAASELDGVIQVKVDLESKTATVEYNEQKVSIATIKEAIEDQGYDVI